MTNSFRFPLEDNSVGPSRWAAFELRACRSSGPCGVRVFLVEDQVLEVAGDVEADSKGVGVGAHGGVSAVDGFDDNAAL